MSKRSQLFQRRKGRTRTKLRKTANGRPRLSVFRSSNHIYAQVIDDETGRTVASASTIEKDVREGGAFGGNRDAAGGVGKRIAERAIAAGVSEVIFDRGGFLYHGRLKALADAAREGGLKF